MKLLLPFALATIFTSCERNDYQRVHAKEVYKEVKENGDTYTLIEREEVVFAENDSSEVVEPIVVDAPMAFFPDAYPLFAYPNGGLARRGGGGPRRDRCEDFEGDSCNTGLDAPCDAGIISCEQGQPVCRSNINVCGEQIYYSGVTYPIGPDLIPTALALGDFDGDGDIDAVSANFLGNNISILFNNGDGIYSPFTNYAAGNNMVAIAVADLDNDNDLDIVASSIDDDAVFVFLNNGAGIFSAGISYPAGNEPAAQSLALGDINNDGNIDIVVGNPNSINVLINNGLGSFSAPVSYPALGNVNSLVLKDIDNDDDLDLLGALDSNFAVYINNDGVFAPAVNYSTPAFSHSIVVGDINNDGYLDAVTVSITNINSFFGDGEGSFTAGTPTTISSSSKPALLQDFDKDGNLDLLINFSNSQVQIYPNNGLGNFNPGGIYNSGSSRDLRAADVNGDKYLDLVSVNGISGTLAVLIGNKDNTFPTPTEYSVDGLSRTVALGDLDGD